MNKVQSKEASKIFAPFLQFPKPDLISDDAREIAKIVLIFVAAGLFMTSALVAPNAAGQVAKLILAWNRNRRKVRRVIARLRRKRYITLRRQGTGWIIVPTKQGRALAQVASLDYLTIRKPRWWDHTWRAVIFDIPERKKVARDVLRLKLRSLGFTQVQKSVWILPWPCRKEIDFIRELFDLEDYVTLWEIPDSADFADLRTTFSLK